MIRLFATAVIAVALNAIGLIVAAIVLDRMHLGAAGCAIAVLIFTGMSVLVDPFLRQTAMKSAPALIGSTAIVTVLVSLIVTTIVSDSLTIRGLSTWVLATLIVWAVSFAGRLLLPLVIFKKALSAATSARSS